MERKIKRVKIVGGEITKNILDYSFQSFARLPNFTLLLNHYKYIYSKEEKKNKLIVSTISISKKGKKYTIGTQVNEKEFINKKKMLDYFYNDIIKKEWLNIPFEIRDKL